MHVCLCVRVRVRVCVFGDLINYLHHCESSVDTVCACTCSSQCLKDDLCVMVALEFSSYWFTVFWDSGVGYKMLKTQKQQS